LITTLIYGACILNIDNYKKAMDFLNKWVSEKTYDVAEGSFCADTNLM